MVGTKPWLGGDVREVTRVKVAVCKAVRSLSKTDGFCCRTEERVEQRCLNQTLIRSISVVWRKWDAVLSVGADDGRLVRMLANHHERGSHKTYDFRQMS